MSAQCSVALTHRCYCANHVISFTPALSKTAVLLLAHGTPENPDQIPEYLLHVTGGRPLLPEVIEEIRHRYSLIGHSPLSCWTLRQAEQLSQALDMPVFVGMRNWQPFIADSVKAISTQGFERVIAICLAPQNSRTSVGMYRRAVVGEGRLPFILDFVEEWHDRPLLVKAFAEKLRAGYEKANAEHGARLPVIFTAHSVPQRTIDEGDPYAAQAKETAALVAKEAGLSADDWTFAFQSQGMSGGPWIGPTGEETILNLKARGYAGIFMHPVGFLCDHVEVLYDIDIAFKAFAEKKEMRLWRGESLNGSPILTAALSELVRSRVVAVSN
jgi:ferrochelatase